MSNTDISFHDKKEKVKLVHKLSRLSLRKKVNFIGVIVVLLFSLILFLRVLPLLEKGKLEERRGKLQAVVNSVVSLMDYYERALRQEAWKTDPSMPKNIEEAKQLVIKNIKQMRYDKTEYFFILDGNGTMVMHPLKPELEGKNLMEEKNKEGVLVFKNLVTNSQRDNEAFVSYIWQAKYSPIIFEPQTTYSKYFWQWDWVVCSGVYTQDILDSMRDINYLSAGYVVVTSALTIVLLFVFVYFNLTKPLTSLLKGIEEIRKDNLDYQVTPSYNDELGDITRQFNMMVDHRKRTQKELEELNSSLEDKVIERTAELNKTLQEVQSLKLQQDGDYFLTSLLLKPLQAQSNSSAKVKTDFIVNQYKQFTFKRWNAELGGDICITDNITLNNKRYIFFVNADAMGKSIQGAGGVLIFGASVKASLIQAKLGKTFTLLPELWLKNLFYDLDHLFLTFDGSMLISAVMGLIDESSGMMYYINSEHPWIVLYRDMRASFIEQETFLRKIGTPEKEQSILRVNLFQLEPGDVIIAGSDGRDDIYIKQADGTEEMNYDEKLFLQSVEKGDAVIEKIVNNIRESGKIRDDLSLLTVKYEGREAKVIEELNAVDKEVLYKAQKLIRDNKNEQAIHLLKDTFDDKPFSKEVFDTIKEAYKQSRELYKYAELLVNAHNNILPEDNKLLYDIAESLYELGNYRLAADYGECLRIREPMDPKILILLSLIYSKDGNYNTSLSRLEQALHLDPKNKEALDLIGTTYELIKANELNAVKEDKEHTYDRFVY